MVNHDPVREEYSRLARRYDTRWAFYHSATVRETLRRVEVREGHRVLDVGCGTGNLMLALSEAVSRIELAGIDPCAEMLELARQKLPRSIELRESGAEHLPFPSESFDVVVSTSALHDFRDPLRVLSEIKRVLKPNGELVITDWCHDYLTCRVYDFFLKWINRAHYRTYRAAACQEMLQASGFQRVEVNTFRINWFWGLMTAKSAKEGKRKHDSECS